MFVLIIQKLISMKPDTFLLAAFDTVRCESLAPRPLKPRASNWRNLNMHRWNRVARLDSAAVSLPSTYKSDKDTSGYGTATQRG
jgi:hypothetical protein